MIVMQIGIGCGKGIGVKEPVHIHLIAFVILNQEERGTDIEVMIVLREKDQVRDRERDCRHDRDCDWHDKDKHRYHDRDYDRESQRGNLVVLTTTIVTGPVTVSMQVTNGTAASCMSTTRKTHLVRCQPTIKHGLKT